MKKQNKSKSNTSSSSSSSSTSSNKGIKKFKQNLEEHVLDKDYNIFLNKILGKGGFGQIFLGQCVKDKRLIAIKCEETSNNQKSHLIIEYNILKDLYGGVGIPKVYKLIKGHRHNYMIMQLLGKSLDKLFNECDRILSIKTVSMIAIQIISRLQYIHSKGYIHRDIKPGNFIFGNNDNNNDNSDNNNNKTNKSLYLIDFGLSKKYLDNNGEHILFKSGKGLTGTARYVSIFTHKGYEQSRRDDIIGMAYVLIYILKGRLPWQNIKAKSKKEKHLKIFEIKMSVKNNVLCYGLPEEYETLLTYAEKLDFNEEPDYTNICIMFKKLIESKKENIDWIYDWDNKDYSSSNSNSNI